LLLFRRGKVLRTIEEGLEWKSAGSARIPENTRFSPEGVFISVPSVYGKGQLDQYIEALRAEADYLLCSARPQWAHLYGSGLYELPIDKIRAIAQAACPGVDLLGMELDPMILEPGAVAGYRSIGVERFCFKVVAPGAGIDEPVRRARALGAFTSAEACFGGQMAGKPFLQAVDRLLAASPNQICISDVRSRGAFGAEILEKAGELCTASGYKRVSLWLWARNGNRFDTLALLLSGKCAGLGPGAVNFRSTFYTNPDTAQWLQARQHNDFSAARAGGRLEQWLALAEGLYNMELKRESLDSRMYRHAFALERMGIVDRKGHPSPGWPMEFCHRAARAAQEALTGYGDFFMQTGRPDEMFPAAGRED